MRSIILLLLFVIPIGCKLETPSTPSPSHSQTTGEMSFDLQGHRGARGLIPENTIPSFIFALDQGVTTLEMDVVISKDSMVVLSHEPWFSSQICSKPDGTPIPEEEEKDFNLFQMTYDEIQMFDCGSRGNPRFPRQIPVEVTKPLLSEVIKEVEQYTTDKNLPAVRYNIETKSSAASDGVFHPSPEIFTSLVMGVISESGITDRAILQSFDVRTLQEARKLGSEMSLALLVGSHEEMNFDAWLEHLGFTPDIYSPYYKLVDSSLVERVHSKDMQLIPWTINTLEEMQALLDMGVDGIITDYPDIGSTLLKE